MYPYFFTKISENPEKGLYNKCCGIENAIPKKVSHSILQHLFFCMKIDMTNF